MSAKLKKRLIRNLIGAGLFAALFVVAKTGVLSGFPKEWILFGLSVAVYLFVGYDVLFRAGRNIVHGKVFDENFLMTVATFAAFGIGEYMEAVAVMVFYQIGEWFQDYAVGKSRKSVGDLMKIAPEYANVEKDGELTEVDPDEVEIGDVFVVKPGERVPIDGVVVSGSSRLDTSSLTGESVPRSVTVGSEIISGCINVNGVLRAEATKRYEDSTVSRILELVENASSRKASVENFITRFAKYYTPIVTIAAVLLALIPPLLFHEPFDKWIRSACSFLVISCPCAVVISVPLGFFGGIGASSKIGVLVKGSNYLEVLSKVKTMAFDKTGTLTKGEFSVAETVTADGVSAAELMKAAVNAEKYSTHPAADAIRKYGETLGIVPEAEMDVEEIAGHGVVAANGGGKIFAGNRKLAARFYGDAMPQSFEEIESAGADHAGGTVVFVGNESKLLGKIVISDAIKEGAHDAVADLRKAGVEKLVLLTGDRKEAGEAAAKELGFDEAHTELLPVDKMTVIESLLSEDAKKKTAFVGDGINDAPVLMRSDVGIAMGSLGSDAAIEAADVVLMDDDVRKIARTVRIARKTLRIVKEDIVIALTVKFVVLCLGALGLASMWLAVFADVGVAVIAILNSMRTMNLAKD